MILKLPGHLLCAMLFSVALVACGPKEKECPAASAQDQAWLPYHSGEIIRFKNDAGTVITFVAGAPDISPARTEKCDRSGLIGKNYCDVCQAYASIGAVSDTNRNNNSLSINVDDQQDDDSPFTMIYYHVFDCGGSLALDGSGNPKIPLVSVTVGGSVYNDVYINQSDTLVSGALVWKAYYNKQYGVIGFEDRKTHSTFYRY